MVLRTTPKYGIFASVALLAIWCMSHPPWQLGADGALFMGVNAGDLHAVENALARGADCNARDAAGFTPLAHAAMLGHHAIVEMLLARGADPNAKMTRGYRPLMLAAAHGHAGTLRVMVEHGADPNLRTDAGDSALVLACQNGHYDAVKALLQCGDSVNVRGSLGCTPLIAAAGAHNPTLVARLIVAGADIHAVDNNGVTALSEAISAGDSATMAMLFVASLVRTGRELVRPIHSASVETVGHVLRRRAYSSAAQRSSSRFAGSQGRPGVNTRCSSPPAGPDAAPIAPGTGSAGPPAFRASR